MGISTDSLLSGASKTSTFRPGKRPAPNVGIFERIVQSEKLARDGYKYYSVAINGCLGGQVVVASALTAMGAAGTSHGAITAFGAINTIIAGFLTYLKGSGLLSRLKYYENEWKKLREYIEQRERDLSQPGSASVDVYAVIAIIESMYEETKADIEVNTPDGYFSINNIRQNRTLEKLPMARHPASGTSSGPMTEEPQEPHETRERREPREPPVDPRRSYSVSTKPKDLETSLSEKLHDAEIESLETHRTLREGPTALSEKLHDAEQESLETHKTSREGPTDLFDVPPRDAQEHRRPDTTVAPGEIGRQNVLRPRPR